MNVCIETRNRERNCGKQAGFCRKNDTCYASHQIFTHEYNFLYHIPEFVLLEQVLPLCVCAEKKTTSEASDEE